MICNMGTALPIDMKKFNLSQHSDDDIRQMIFNAVDIAREDMCENGVPIKKGLYELLNKLSEKRIPMVVATSTPIKWSGRLLRAAKVWERFKFVITSQEVENGKPAPDIFLKSCEIAKVAPENALVLEDSIPGAQAAKAAGIPYIIVPDINPPTKKVAQAAYMVADSLLDVVKLI